MKRFLTALLVSVGAAVVAAQVPIPNLLARIPSLTALVEGQPLSTSLDDAVGALPMLDDYEPRFGPMTTLPLGPGGGACSGPALTR